MASYVAILFMVAGAAKGQTSPGVLSLLHEKPFKAEVSKASSGSSGYSLLLKRVDGGMNSFTAAGGQQECQAFVATLQEGKTYDFPRTLIEFLGPEGTVATLRQYPQLPPFSGLPPQIPMVPVDPTLAGLVVHGKFRAKVLDRQTSETGYSIILQTENFRLFVVEGVIDTAETQALVSHLRKGESHDFPDVINKFSGKTVDRMLPSLPLRKYVGRWKGRIDGMNAMLQMNCTWLADGSGLRRELVFDDLSDNDPSRSEEAVISYHPESKSYVAVGGGATPLIMTWQDKSNTFTTTLPNPPVGHTRVNIATFTTDDRIDWRTITRDQNGNEIATTCGHYDRVSGQPVTSGFAGGNGITFTTITHGQHMSGDLRAQNPAENISWLDIGSAAPFRARVVEIRQSPTSATMKLACTDGRQLEFRQVGNVIMHQIKGWLSFLKEGEMYEFPDMLHHPELHQTPAPPSPEMASLQPFIGVWDSIAHMSKGEVIKGTLTCTWKADGKGMWRELVREASGDMPETKVAELITFDAASGKHRRHMTRQNDRLGVVYDWDPVKKTVSTQVAPSQPGGKVSNNFTEFKSDDVIEWRTITKSEHDVVIGEISGRYTRAAKK